jgi:RNA polymerase sigma-70 factor (ECF subfamily)
MEGACEPGDLQPWRRAADGTEAALLDRARGGDRGAQAALLERHYRGVHALAFRLLGNPEDAEDLAQECFVRAFRSLSFYRGEGSLAGWLRRILVHLAQDRFRSRRPSDEPLLDEPFSVATREPHARLEERELVRFAARALEGLGSALRTTLLLRTREGLEYEAIAELTGVTPATARTRVMKARRALLRSLAPYLTAEERASAAGGER